MDKKYWVPALERGKNILDLISRRPSQLRLIDICRELELTKSSVFSQLNTLEQLGLVRKEVGDTYSLGPSLGILGGVYFSQFKMLETFHREAKPVAARIHETLQLGILDGTDVLYLAKEETAFPYVVSNPGTRYPAQVTGLGKVQLAQLDYDALLHLYEGVDLVASTPHSITNLDALWEDLEEIRERGYALDREEAVLGFCCVAAPIYNHTGLIIAGTSVTMTADKWEEKHELATREVVGLAAAISWQAGHRST